VKDKASRSCRESYDEVSWGSREGILEKGKEDHPLRNEGLFRADNKVRPERAVAPRENKVAPSPNREKGTAWEEGPFLG